MKKQPTMEIDKADAKQLLKLVDSLACTEFCEAEMQQALALDPKTIIFQAAFQSLRRHAHLVLEERLP